MHLARPVLVFAPISDRLASDPVVRRQALEVRELLATRTAADLAAALTTPGDWFALLMVDGVGRAVPSPVAPDGLFGREPWRPFTATAPGMISQQGLACDLRDTEAIDTGLARLRLDVQSMTSVGVVGVAAGLDGFTPDVLAAHATTLLRHDEIPVAVTWPDPLGRWFPRAAALDAWEAWGRMRAVLRAGEAGRVAEALAAAETALAQRSFEITMRSISDLWGICALHDGDDAALIEAAGMYGIDAPDLDALVAHPDFHHLTHLPTCMPFVIGVIGYIWQRLVEALRDGYIPRRCDGCGTLLPGTVTKRRRFCDARENPTCVRARHAAYERRRHAGGNLH